MQVVWLFPPVENGFPNISQYRFYKKMPIRATIIYPYLAASGATQIKEAGHEIRFMDCPTMSWGWDKVESELSDSDLVIMEGRTPVIRQMWDAIGKVKGINPQVKVAVYGDHVSWNPTETLDQGADVILQGGDFDFSAAWLVKRMAEGRNMRGVVNCGLLDSGLLDGLPWVDRELVNWRNYYESWRKRDVFLWNMGMRGCPFHCVYCAWAGTFWENRLRHRDPRDVADETAQLFKKYGELEILDDADLFELAPWGKVFADQLLEKGFKSQEILWSCQTHPSQVIKAREFMPLLKKSGLRTVKLGIESGNDRSLLFMRKGSTRQMCEKAIRILQENDVIVHANMMIGFPWESRRDVEETLSWIKRLDPNQAQFSLVIPYPNTELWHMAEKMGWFIQDPGDWSLYDAEFPMMKMDGLSGEEIVDLYRDAWSSFYMDPKFIWRQIKRVSSLREIRELWHGFRSVRFGHMKAVSKKRGKTQ